jgi:hypothetical protein
MENITLTELATLNTKELKSVKKFYIDKIKSWKEIQKQTGELRHQYSAQAIIGQSTQFINAIDQLLQQA